MVHLMYSLAKVREVFRKWDATGKGLIRRDNLLAIISFLESGREAELRSLLDCHTDPHHDDCVIFEAFLEDLWSDADHVHTSDLQVVDDSKTSKSFESEIEHFRIAFAKIDTDGDGLISILEFTKLVRHLSIGMMPSHSVVNAFFRRANAKASAQLSFDDFCTFASALKAGLVDGLPAIDIGGTDINLSMVTTPSSQLGSPMGSNPSRCFPAVKLNSPRLGPLEIQLNAAPLSSADILQLKLAFKKLDPDSHGFISILELTRLLRHADDVVLPHKTLNALFRRCDTDNDARLDFSDFCRLVGMLKSGTIEHFPVLDVIELSRTYISS